MLESQEAIMTHLFGALALAAGKPGETNAVIVWHFSGELSCSVVIDLRPSQVSVTALRGEVAHDIRVDWTITWPEALALAGGALRLNAALDEDRFVVSADRIGIAKMVKTLKAWSRVNLRALLLDPRSEMARLAVEKKLGPTSFVRGA